METEWDNVFSLLFRLLSRCEIYMNPVSKPQVQELNGFKIPEKEDVLLGPT